ISIMIAEERLIIPKKTSNRFLMMIGLGLVLLVLGVILMMTAGPAHHDAHGAAEAGHHATTWYERLLTNLWLNNVYFTGIAVVGLFFTTVQYVAYAGWSVLIKQVLEALAYFLPVGGVIMILVFILPIIF